MNNQHGVRYSLRGALLRRATFSLQSQILQLQVPRVLVHSKRNGQLDVNNGVTRVAVYEL